MTENWSMDLRNKVLEISGSNKAYLGFSIIIEVCYMVILILAVGVTHHKLYVAEFETT